MGIYAVTGGSHGIGAKTVELLKKEGHEVINIDLLKGDITADLVTLEGRQKVIDELHALHPEGLDGLILSAAVSGACGSLTKIISLNYFGAVSVIKGTYDLLEKRHGRCVAVSSNIISQDISRMDIADLLNNSGDDEHKIRSRGLLPGRLRLKCRQQHLRRLPSTPWPAGCAATPPPTQPTAYVSTRWPRATWEAP